MQRRRPEPISVPAEGNKSYKLTDSGTFVEGDLTISREGLQITNSPNVSAKDSTVAGSSGNSAPKDISDSVVDLSPDDLEDLGIIGQGSSGIAKKVKIKQTGDIRVLKVIQFDVNSDIVRKQITTELRTLYGANHSNVVRYLQAFFDEGAVTIVMEYMDAGSLADILKRHRKLHESYVSSIARQIVAGLCYLHKDLRVVHRDIKPSNLLLNSKGELKISDFGVSGQLGSSVSNCLSWVGTVTYMSPERIKGESYSFDSDLWSLGLTLLECSLGRFPYPPPGENGTLGFWELLEYIVMEPAPLLPPDQFSTELCDFVSLCLQKDANYRPTVTRLLEHPFLYKYENVSLSDLIAPCGALATVGRPLPQVPLPPAGTAFSGIKVSSTAATTSRPAAAGPMDPKPAPLLSSRAQTIPHARPQGLNAAAAAVAAAHNSVSSMAQLAAKNGGGSISAGSTGQRPPLAGAGVRPAGMQLGFADNIGYGSLSGESILGHVGQVPPSPLSPSGSSCSSMLISPVTGNAGSAATVEDNMTPLLQQVLGTPGQRSSTLMHSKSALPAGRSQGASSLSQSQSQSHHLVSSVSSSSLSSAAGAVGASAAAAPVNHHRHSASASGAASRTVVDPITEAAILGLGRVPGPHRLSSSTAAAQGQDGNSRGGAFQHNENSSYSGSVSIQDVLGNAEFGSARNKRGGVSQQ